MRANLLGLLVAVTVLAIVNSAQATESVLHSFCSPKINCADGANPVADLVQDGPDGNGNLWGTAENGGKFGLGTIFELTQNSGFKSVGQLYSFGSQSGDGAHPKAGLIFDAGTFYGTTSGGGKNGCGTVFALVPGNSSDQVLHSFGCAPNDGANPTSELVSAGNGNFYGTTSAGGKGGNCNCGTVFVLNPNNNTYNVLYTFTGGSAGANPLGGLVLDAQGNLWGTARNGGTNNLGTIFELTAASHFTALGFVYSFQGSPNDGANPAAALVFDATVGNFYGTTSGGGSGPCSGGCGTVFYLTPAKNAYQLLYSFKNQKSGAAPVAPLAVETASGSNKGNLFGTASGGGNLNGACGIAGCGTAFEICAPQNIKTCGWREYTLFQFNGRRGENPEAGMLLGVVGGSDAVERGKIPPPIGRGACTSSCVGTAANGGANGAGAVIGITP